MIRSKGEARPLGNVVEAVRPHPHDHRRDPPASSPLSDMELPDGRPKELQANRSKARQAQVAADGRLFRVVPLRFCAGGHRHAGGTPPVMMPKLGAEGNFRPGFPGIPSSFPRTRTRA